MNLESNSKSMKNAVRYIKQDASSEPLDEIHKVVHGTITKRTIYSQQKNRNLLV